MSKGRSGRSVTLPQPTVTRAVLHWRAFATGLVSLLVAAYDVRPAFGNRDGEGTCSFFRLRILIVVAMHGMGKGLLLFGHVARR